jgi:ankyrin repeat protein
VIELLAKHKSGLDVAACDPRGNTALHCAVANGHVVAAQTLVRLGVPMDRSHAPAFPVLHLAALSGHDQVDHPGSIRRVECVTCMLASWLRVVWIRQPRAERRSKLARAPASKKPTNDSRLAFARPVPLPQLFGI